jgi:hypothetical protein
MAGFKNPETPCTGSPTPVACVPCRRSALEKELQREGLPDDEKRRYLAELEKRESDFTRLQRQRLSADCFEPLRIIGRGAFGEVGRRLCGSARQLSSGASLLALAWPGSCGAGLRAQLRVCCSLRFALAAWRGAASGLALQQRPPPFACAQVKSCAASHPKRHTLSRAAAWLPPSLAARSALFARRPAARSWP